MAVIKIEHLTKDYGNKKGIFDVSFTIEKGEVFGFLGPNGAGKTTAIRHLLGFLFAKEGACFIQDMDCGKEAHRIHKTLGYIPGEINLMEDMNGMQFLKFMAQYRGMKDMGRCEELLERFDLDPRGKIKKMSKGMKQKIGIVAAFMHDPDVLILDEPTSGLDPLMQNEFVELILEEKAKGKTILMSSHMFEEVEKTCDRVGIIKDGRMVSVEEIEVLRKGKKKQYRIVFQTTEEALRFTKENLRIHTHKGKEVVVVIHDDLSHFLSLLPKYQITSLDVVQQSLEEVFMQYYGGIQHV